MCNLCKFVQLKSICMICNKCKEDKPESEFYRWKNIIQKPCKKCRQKRIKDNFMSRPEEERQLIHRVRYLRSKGFDVNYDNVEKIKKGKFHPWSRNMISRIRGRSRTGGTEKFIKDERVNAKYLRDLYDKQKGLCYYTGMFMDLDRAMYKPSADRVDSSIGYVDGNIVLCCTAINYMKNSFTEEETLDFIELIKQSKKL